MAKRVLIVGGVAGGATAAARLSRLDNGCEIIMFERGKYVSYANCGLPYYIGNVIKKRDSLLLLTPEAMEDKFRIQVRIRHEVIAIDPGNKTVTVKNLTSDEIYTEPYDVLILATGSSPIQPNLPGIDSPKVKYLWTVPQTDEIESYLSEHKVREAVVIGGGFIGIEVAENLKARGIDVTIVEMMNQVMAPFDFEMAQMLHAELDANGVKLRLGNGIVSLEDHDETISLTLSDGEKIETELVLCCIGVRPNSQLARDAGLRINKRGGIIVNDRLQTSDPAIYAVGDVIEIEEFILKQPGMIPLAGPANKQGRIAADNICGRNKRYEGTQGSSIVKIFNLTAASTGLNEKQLKMKELVKGKDYECAYLRQNSHARYFPGSTPMMIKMIYSIDGKKIFGAQIIGKEGVDKRIDTIGVAIRLGADVHDLTELELAYAPPFSSAKDPVNMAGYVAENMIDGLVEFCEWDAIENPVNEKQLVLDVREQFEWDWAHVRGAKLIRADDIRARMKELDPSVPLIVMCAAGVRAYNAARILLQHGFKNVKVYPGGINFYLATHYNDHRDVVFSGADEATSG